MSEDVDDVFRIANEGAARSVSTAAELEAIAILVGNVGRVSFVGDDNAGWIVEVLANVCTEAFTGGRSGREASIGLRSGASGVLTDVEEGACHVTGVFEVS